MLYFLGYKPIKLSFFFIYMVVRVKPYHIESVGLTDVGLVRQRNEDVWAAVPEYRIYALADGMGGHPAGDVAADEAVNAFCAVMKKKIESSKRKRGIDELRNLVERTIIQVNRFLYKLGRTHQELRGMGTTLCCMCFHDKGLIYAHVGDSRIYRLRNQKLEQMTEDHSLLRELIDLGQIGERQAEEFLYKNIITKAIGTESVVEPSVGLTDIDVGDIYLMCTDGLSDLVAPEEIEAVINQAPTMNEAATNLIECAKQKGGHDNITLVMLDVQENHGKDLSRQ